MALGRLLKALHTLSLHEQQLPYENLSIKDVLAGLSDMQLPHHCEAGRVGYSTKKKACGGRRLPPIVRIQELRDRFGVEVPV